MVATKIRVAYDSPEKRFSFLFEISGQWVNIVSYTKLILRIHSHESISAIERPAMHLLISFAIDPLTAQSACPLVSIFRQVVCSGPLLGTERTESPDARAGRFPRTAYTSVKKGRESEM